MLQYSKKRKGVSRLIIHKTYWLSQIISVHAVVSADYIEGCFTTLYHHSHPDAWELVLVRSGTAHVGMAGNTVVLRQNEMILLCPGIRHDIQIDDPKSKTFVLAFVCTNDSCLIPIENIPLKTDAALIPIVKSMIQELTDAFEPEASQLHLIRFTPDIHAPVGVEQMICTYLEQFLILTLRKTTMIQGSVASASQFHNTLQTYLVNRVTDYIQQNLSTHLTVQQIADHVHYSRARLSAVYKELTGISIGDAITNAQIQRAKELLLTSQKSIAQISEELGFSTAQYFTYKFSKMTGTTPSRYRNKK